MLTRSYVKYPAVEVASIINYLRVVAGNVDLKKAGIDLDNEDRMYELWESMCREASMMECREEFNNILLNVIPKNVFESELFKSEMRNRIENYLARKYGTYNILDLVKRARDVYTSGDALLLTTLSELYWAKRYFCDIISLVFSPQIRVVTSNVKEELQTLNSIFVRAFKVEDLRDRIDNQIVVTDVPSSNFFILYCVADWRNVFNPEGFPLHTSNKCIFTSTGRRLMYYFE